MEKTVDYYNKFDLIEGYSESERLLNLRGSQPTYEYTDEIGETKEKWILKTLLQGKFMLAYQRATYKSEWEKWYEKIKFAQKYPNLYNLKKWLKRKLFLPSNFNIIESLSFDCKKDLEQIRTPWRTYLEYGYPNIENNGDIEV